MKDRVKVLALAAVGLFLLGGAVLTRIHAGETGHNTKVYVHQGGDTLTLESGGTLNAESGSTATLAGTNTLSGANAISGATTITGATTFSTGSAPTVASGVTETIASGGALAIAGKVTTPLLTVTVETTLTAAQSGATVIYSGVDGRINLPSEAAGLQYTITQNASSTTSGLRIYPAAADKIVGASIAVPAVAKSLINTPATDNPGDAVTLIANGVDGWQVRSVVGIWAKEP